MERKDKPTKASKKEADRDQRLKAALKANMARRKAQARARSAGEQAQDSKNKE